MTRRQSPERVRQEICDAMRGLCLGERLLVLSVVLRDLGQEGASLGIVPTPSPTDIDTGTEVQIADLPPALTPTQAKALGWVESYLQRSGGFPPTVREIANALGIDSTTQIRDCLDALARKGCIEWSGSSQSLRLLRGVA